MYAQYMVELLTDCIHDCWGSALPGLQRVRIMGGSNLEIDREKERERDRRGSY